ncbi:MAG: hypothetical protein ACTHWU_02125 [Senegalia sp. (in: firmicutes)]|uniref:hypothetical protein n=1 Tax=Senegalia sp. (in: firmicutes) TaxID=1924098 RepID=UPI003F9BFBE2
MKENEISLLKWENEIQKGKIKGKDKNIIKNIMKSMSIFKVNSYDAEVIKRDLIGMAHELKLRNSSLNEEINGDVKGFAKEIIANSNGPSKIEIILKFLSELFGLFFMWLSSLSLLAYREYIWELNPNIFIFFIITVLITFIIESIINPIFVVEKGIKKAIPQFISILSFIILVIIIISVNDNSKNIEINSLYIIIPSGIAYLIVKYLNGINIHKLAKGKNNYINDLK